MSRLRRVWVLVSLAFLLIGSKMMFLDFVIAQPAQQWAKTYGTTSYSESAYSMIKTTDGGYAVAGCNDTLGNKDFWLVKLDTSGDHQWNKTYGGASFEEARAVVQTSDGGYAVAGSFGVVKTDVYGSMIFYSENLGNVRSMVQTSDGGFALVAFDVIIKLSSTGQKEWQLAGPSGRNYYSLIQASDGEYAVAGTNSSSGNVDFLLCKLNQLGTIWAQTYGGTGSSEYAYRIIKTSDGGYALAGSTNSLGNTDFWLVKTDSSGNMQWNKTYGGASFEEARAVVQTSDGGYALAGASTGTGDLDFWLVKTDSSGNMQWNKTYGGSGSQDAVAVVQASDEGYVMAGRTDPGGTGSYDFLIVKTYPFTTLTVSAEPASTSVIAGESATFTATASGGTSPYTYQWYEGTSLLSGQTSAQLTTSKSSAGSFTYYCNVSDSGGQTAKSNTVSLTVTAPTTPTPTTPAPTQTATPTPTTPAPTQTPTPTPTPTTPTPSPSPSPSQSLGFPPEGFIVIGVIAMAVVAAVIIYKFMKRPKKPPAPAQLRITAEPASIVADGETKSVITMQLLDKKGNPIAAIADTQVKITATKGKLATPIVTIPKGKDAEKTVIVSSTETGPVPVSADAEGLKSITITLNFMEKKRYCMHCGALFPTKAKACLNCGKVPPAGVDTKVCQNCKSVIPIIAKFCSECGAGQKE